MPPEPTAFPIESDENEDESSALKRQCEEQGGSDLRRFLQRTVNSVPEEFIIAVSILKSHDYP